MLCWATFLKVQNFPKRVDSIYVNAVSAIAYRLSPIGIVSEPNAAVSVEQRDNFNQVVVVCSAD